MQKPPGSPEHSVLLLQVEPTMAVFGPIFGSGFNQQTGCPFAIWLHA